MKTGRFVAYGELPQTAYIAVHQCVADTRVNRENEAIWDAWIAENCALGDWTRLRINVLDLTLNGPGFAPLQTPKRVEYHFADERDFVMFKLGFGG